MGGCAWSTTVRQNAHTLRVHGIGTQLQSSRVENCQQDSRLYERSVQKRIDREPSSCSPELEDGSRPYNSKRRGILRLSWQTRQEVAPIPAHGIPADSHLLACSLGTAICQCPSSMDLA